MVAREDVGGWPSNLGMLAPTKPQFLRQPTSDADGGYATAQQDLREDKIIGRTELVYMLVITPATVDIYFLTP